MGRALGRYELLRPLARGGMADVFLARRRAAGIEKWLVVKRMRPGTSGDPRFLDLFVREARLSMSLAHQNIVPVFDFGRIDDQVFLAMERVEGNDLGLSLARAADRRLPPLLAAFIAAECCQALDYAHRRKGPDGAPLGIVHRDVTPRNVLLSWSGEVKLTDFGIAAIAGDPTTRLLGTPHYMAPEQARREPIDPRADIYAVGLVLREAVSGVCPRPGEDRETILAAARSAELVPWSLRRPAMLALGSGDHTPPRPPSEPGEPIPPALVAIIDRATAPAPADRYPDARAMLEDLDDFIIAERAARKADPPARQLAAWLSAVWDGAREAREPEIVAETLDLIDSLDDAAFDAIGDGTLRSLAATAADEARLALPAKPPEPVVALPALAPEPVVIAIVPPVEPRPVVERPRVRAVGSGAFARVRAPRVRARGTATRRRPAIRRHASRPSTRSPARGALVPAARTRPTARTAALLGIALASVALLGATTASIAASLVFAAALGAFATVALSTKR